MTLGDASLKVTVVVSDVETREIKKFLPAATIVRVSNIHADLAAEITPQAYRERTGCVFVGNWNHLPNRDAALWFASEILPKVHLCFFFLIVVGVSPPSPLAHSLKIIFF